MPYFLEAYLDIETTGLSPVNCQITTVGIYVTNETYSRFVQLVGEEVTTGNLLEALSGATNIYTYNGSRFDLPFIRFCTGLDLAALFPHCDLMYVCWRNSLYGGLKAVERQLGIARKLKDIQGYDAIRLWQKYQSDSDEDALATLLEYNKEDVINLKSLKENLL
ncbi:ribonuclease H-like domain-containing protein [Chloroflexota bacterium]